MSIVPAREPVDTVAPSTPEIAHVIDARARDIGGFAVKRLLPSIARKFVGPFAFFDEMGPVDFLPGSGLAVPPHPHIGLATVTYLFEGEIVHRDSIGSLRAIRPGDVNWMTAGRGVVHSERSSPEMRQRGSRLHGLQLWVALPLAHEEDEPTFAHHASAALPELEVGGVRLRVLAGEAYGATSPRSRRSSTSTRRCPPARCSRCRTITSSARSTSSRAPSDAVRSARSPGACSSSSRARA